MFQNMELKFGIGIKEKFHEFNTKPIYGIDFGYLLKKTDLIKLFNAEIQFESELNAFIGRVDSGNRQNKSSIINRLYFSLIGPIFLNVTHEFFLYKELDSSKPDSDYAFASDLTFGLSYNGQLGWQQF